MCRDGPWNMLYFGIYHHGQQFIESHVSWSPYMVDYLYACVHVTVGLFCILNWKVSIGVSCWNIGYMFKHAI